MTELDELMCRYRAMAADAAARPHRARCGFLQVDGRALAAEVGTVAAGWGADYAGVLHDSSRALLDDLTAKVARQRHECIAQATDDLEALKRVLNAIAFVEAEQMDVELAYNEGPCAPETILIPCHFFFNRRFRRDHAIVVVPEPMQW